MTNLEQVARGMLRAAKARATLKGLPFNLTLDDIHIPQRCPILGIPLIVGQPQATDNSPSLDRVKPEMGYVRGNCLVVSNRVNRIKNDSNVPELHKIAEFYERYIRDHWMK